MWPRPERGILDFPMVGQGQGKCSRERCRVRVDDQEESLGLRIVADQLRHTGCATDVTQTEQAIAKAQVDDLQAFHVRIPDKDEVRGQVHVGPPLGSTPSAG